MPGGMRILVFTLLMSLASITAASASQVLDTGKWDPNTRAKIQRLIEKYGQLGRDYDPDKKPYAVFEWDQTAIFNSAQEAFFHYLVDNLLFRATPAEFAAAIRRNVPRTDFPPAYTNQAGQPVNLDRIAADLDADYAYLFENHIDKKRQSLDEIRQSVEFIDFQAKLSYLYRAVGGTFGPDVGTPWLTYLFVGMTEDEVRETAEKAYDRALGDRLSTYALTSPAERPGRAGVVSLDGYAAGLRLMPEIADLMHVMQNNGIEVYVCTAAHKTLVRVFASLPKYGYGVPEDNIIAMQTMLEDGQFLAEYSRRGVFPRPHRQGKVKAIKHFLVARHGHGPIFVAGDNRNDFSMATDFADTKMTLIINRLLQDDFGRLGLMAQQTRDEEIPRYVLQGRDENIGQFRPSPATIAQGRDREALFHPAIQPE